MSHWANKLEVLVLTYIYGNRLIWVVFYWKRSYAGKELKVKLVKQFISILMCIKIFTLSQIVLLKKSKMVTIIKIFMLVAWPVLTWSPCLSCHPTSPITLYIKNGDSKLETLNRNRNSYLLRYFALLYWRNSVY